LSLCYDYDDDDYYYYYYESTDLSGTLQKHAAKNYKSAMMCCIFSAVLFLSSLFCSFVTDF